MGTLTSYGDASIAGKRIPAGIYRLGGPAGLDIFAPSWESELARTRIGDPPEPTVHERASDRFEEMYGPVADLAQLARTWIADTLVRCARRVGGAYYEPPTQDRRLY